MRMPALGWAFLVFFVFVLVGYLLVTGVYVGKDIKAFPRVDGGSIYTFSCRYLYFTGVRDVPFNVYRDTREQAAKDFCPVLWNSN